MKFAPSTRLIFLCCALYAWPWPADSATAAESDDHLKKAKVFLAAGDYRRALNACQKHVDEAPSAAGYVYLTYVFQALDGYLDHLAAIDRWVGIEQVYWNLISQGPQDLTDRPDVLARIAKEIIQESSRKQSDVMAAMASRLDKAEVARLWKQQTAWRKEHPEDWWAGVPAEWNW